MNMGGGWVLEVDIRKFFDTLDHAHLGEALRHRVRDGVLLRLIGKWLNAGVMEDGSISYPEAGSPQGGVISPLLANVYLHYVLDTWFEREVQPRLAGRAFLIRYADDFVIAFSNESDARRVMEVLPKRFGKYGLILHPEKTRLGRVSAAHRAERGPGGARDVRSAGIHSLLGEIPAWLVGGQASDRVEAVESRVAGDHRLVSRAPALEGRRAEGGSVPEAAGALRLLPA